MRPIEEQLRCSATHDKLTGLPNSDEFVVILDEISSASDAVLVADRLLTRLAKPYLLGGHETLSSASIGIVNVANGRYYAAIVQSLVQLAENLQMKVIVEGVEMGEQLAALQSMECQLGPTFLYQQTSGI